MDPVVVAVCRDASHGFSKPCEASIRLVAGLGVEGDAHCGATVQHVARVKRGAAQPNMRQVHLMHSELHDALNAQGFRVSAGEMGENVTTRGLDLLGLPSGARLHLGATAIVEVTGLRNPCAQLDHFQKGLMAAVLDRDAQGNVIRKSGVMGVVVQSGEVRPGDRIRLELPAEPHVRLEPV